MMKLNWFECDLRCYDGLGMDCSIMDVPYNIRKKIASKIIQGNTCGSFEEEFVDEKKLEGLNKSYVDDVRDVAMLHKTSVAQRKGC